MKSIAPASASANRSLMPDLRNVFGTSRGYRRLLVVVNLLAILLGAKPFLFSQGFSAPKSIGLNSNSRLPVVATDPVRGYVYVVVRGGPSEIGGSEGIWFMRSTDEGATFSAPMNLGPFYAAEASVKVDPTGGIWIVWSQQTEIVVMKSVDAGMTFARMASPPLEDVSNALYTARRNPDIAIDSQGEVDVVWQSQIAPDETDIFVSRSIDGGATFSIPINVSNDAGHSTEPRIAIGTGDSLHVVWGTNMPDGPANSFLGPVQYARSLDGLVFEPPVTLMPAELSTRRSRIAIDAAGAINVVSESGYFVRSTDNGGSFTPAQQIEGFGGLHPDVAAEPDGTIDLVGQTWSTLEFARSTDGGTSFNAQAFANTEGDVEMPSGGIAETGEPRIAVSPTGIHVVWFDASFDPDTDELAGFSSFYSSGSLASPSGPLTILSSSTLDFGEVIIGRSRDLAVLVRNRGNSPLTFEPGGFVISGTGAVPFHLSGDYYSCNNIDWPLLPGESCNLHVLYMPSEEGAGSATVTITSNAVNSPDIIRLAGSGVPPMPHIKASTASLDFGLRPVGSTMQKSVRAVGAGDVPVTLSEITITGPGAAAFLFSTSAPACMPGTALEMDDVCSIPVVFRPVASEDYVATLNITSDAAESSITVSLSGKGGSTSLQLAPSTLDFGSQLVGTNSEPHIVTITNTGDFSAGLSVSLSGDFKPAVTAQFLETLNPGGSKSFEVAFAPKAAGARTGLLTIHNDVDGSERTEPLTGMGTDFQLDVQSGGSTSARVNAGTAANFHLQIEPTGFVGDIALSCTFQGLAPRGTSCSVSPSAVTLNGSDPALFAVNVSTTSRAAALPRVGDHGSPLQPGPWARQTMLLLLGLAMLTLAFASRTSMGRRVREQICATRGWAPLAATLLFLLLWAACGGGADGGSRLVNPNGTPAGSYTLTLSATASGVSRSTALTITVN